MNNLGLLCLWFGMAPQCLSGLENLIHLIWPFPLAANPVPQQTQYAIVGDLCPECSAGDLDQATAGDGRWKISWYPVQCNVGESNFIYSFQGSNPYYLKLQVANTR